MGAKLESNNSLLMCTMNVLTAPTVKSNKSPSIAGPYHGPTQTMSFIWPHAHLQNGQRERVCATATTISHARAKARSVNYSKLLSSVGGSTDEAKAWLIFSYDLEQLSFVLCVQARPTLVPHYLGSLSLIAFASARLDLLRVVGFSSTKFLHGRPQESFGTMTPFALPPADGWVPVLCCPFPKKQSRLIPSQKGGENEMCTRARRRRSWIGSRFVLA